MKAKRDLLAVLLARTSDLLQRPTNTNAKETYYGSKRDLLKKQKRPIAEAKETYCRSKRDLLRKQKRPTTEAKETYYGGSAGLKDTMRNSSFQT